MMKQVFHGHWLQHGKSCTYFFEVLFSKRPKNATIYQIILCTVKYGGRGVHFAVSWFRGETVTFAPRQCQFHAGKVTHFRTRKVPTFVPWEYQLSWHESYDFAASQPVLATNHREYWMYRDFMPIHRSLYHRYIL